MSAATLRRIATAAAVLGLVTVIVLGWRDRDRFRIATAGDVAPEFTLPALHGDSIALSSYRGRIVLLNVWATWCAPCIWEMPAMERAYQEFRDRGFDIIAVNVDLLTSDAARNALIGANVRDYVDELGLTFTIARDPGGVVERAYGVDRLPTSFLLDRDGRIAHREIGPAEWDRGPHRDLILELLES